MQFDTKLGKIIMKFKKLATSIEMTNCSMDDPDYRWVERMIENLESGSYELLKDEFMKANRIWKKVNV